jgi:hypothetical protein
MSNKSTEYTVGKIKVAGEYLSKFNAAGVIEISDSKALFPNRNSNLLTFLDLEDKLGPKFNLVLNRDPELVNRMNADLKGRKKGDKVTFEPTEEGFQVKIGSYPLFMPTNEKLELDFDKASLNEVSEPVGLTAEHFEKLFPKKKVNEGHMVHLLMDGSQITGFRSYSSAKMIGEVSLANTASGGSEPDDKSVIVELESSEFMKLYKEGDSLSVSLKRIDDQFILVSDYVRKDVCSFVTFEKVMKPGESDFAAKSFVKSEGPAVELKDHDGQKVLYSNVRTRIHENYAGHQSNKRVRLKDLILVRKQQSLIPKIRLVYNSDFRKYLQGEFNQDRSTAFADTKIVDVVIEEGKEDLLDSDETDLVYKLRRMVHRQGEQRTDLLNNISNYNRRTLDLWMAANPASDKPVSDYVKKKREVEQAKSELFSQLQKLKEDGSKLDVLALLNDSLLEIKKRLDQQVKDQEAAEKEKKADSK